MAENNERLTRTEIEVAKLSQHLISIDSEIKRIRVKVDVLGVEILANKELLDRWAGGTVLMTKFVALVCTLVGAWIALDSYLS